MVFKNSKQRKVVMAKINILRKQRLILSSFTPIFTFKDTKKLFKEEIRLRKKLKELNK